jgi:ribosome maturation factor RimP
MAMRGTSNSKNSFGGFNLAHVFVRIRTQKSDTGLGARFLDGHSAHFLFVALTMDILELLERTLPGLGYDLVDVERSNHGKLLRVFIDKLEGVTVDDCALVSNHLIRLFQVEGVDYDRLEVSSPGLDRPLRQLKDFQRFEGEKASVRMNVALDGQRKFVGILRGANEEKLNMEIDGALVSLEIADIRKARLIPEI